MISLAETLEAMDRGLAMSAFLELSADVDPTVHVIAVDGTGAGRAKAHLRTVFCSGLTLALEAGVPVDNLAKVIDALVHWAERYPGQTPVVVFRPVSVRLIPVAPTSRGN